MCRGFGVQADVPEHHVRTNLGGPEIWLRIITLQTDGVEHRSCLVEETASVFCVRCGVTLSRYLFRLSFMAKPIGTFLPNLFGVF